MRWETIERESKEGWLQPKDFTQSHGNSGFTPKAEIVFRWRTFLAFEFWFTLPPMVHPTIVGYPNTHHVRT